MSSAPFDVALLPNVLELQPKAHLMVGFSVAFLVLVWVSVALRVYVRIFMIRAFGWDDAVCIMSAVTFSAFSACLIVIAKYSFNQAVVEAYSTGNLVLIWTVLTVALEYVVVYNAFYILTTIVFKISLAIFFLRIVVVPWQRRLICVTTGIYTVYSTAFIFVVTFRCGNPPDLLINAVHGKCISNGALMPLVYISGTLNALADWTFACLPAIILWHSQMPRKTKISAGVLLSMGCLGSIASVIRIAYLGGLSVDARFFKHAIDAGLLSVIEPGLAITAASLSTLRPMFKSMLEKTLPTFFATTGGYGRTGQSITSNKRTGRSRHTFEDQKGFQVFDNVDSRTHTIIATGQAGMLTELDEMSNGDGGLNRSGSQNSLVEQHQHGPQTARQWTPPYDGKGVMMTRQVNISDNSP